MEHNGLIISKSQAEIVTDETYWDYYNRLKEIAINQFEWVDLPGTCDQRFLELILFEFGYGLIFQHNINKSILSLQCTLGGNFNVYRIPQMRQAFAVTGFIQQCTEVDSVIVWNNYLRQPTASTIRLYASRLAEIERTINVNVIAQKTPIVMLGNEKQQKGLQAFFMKFKGNMPAIYGDKNNLDLNDIKILNLEAPERYLNLLTAKQRIWDEALTFIGVNNANTDKKERLITDEVESNNEQLGMQKQIMLNSRIAACNSINSLFGLNVSVRPRKTANLVDAPKKEGEEA